MAIIDEVDIGKRWLKYISLSISTRECAVSKSAVNIYKVALALKKLWSSKVGVKRCRHSSSNNMGKGGVALLSL